MEHENPNPTRCPVCVTAVTDDGQHPWPGGEWEEANDILFPETRRAKWASGTTFVGNACELAVMLDEQPATVLTVTPSRVEASTEGFERTFTLITTLA